MHTWLTQRSSSGSSLLLCSARLLDFLSTFLISAAGPPCGLLCVLHRTPSPKACGCRVHEGDLQGGLLHALCWSAASCKAMWSWHGWESFQVPCQSLGCTVQKAVRPIDLQQVGCEAVQEVSAHASVLHVAKLCCQARRLNADPCALPSVCCDAAQQL